MARLADRLIGNKEALRRLVDAQAGGRLAATLLFAGPSGIGKRLAALALAQALVCEKGGKDGACGACGPCLRIEKRQSESLMMVEPDGAGIKIEQARDLLQFLQLQKLGRSRVVIIDQAHLLNPQAGNALLKALEEPPAGTFIILVTPLAASVLPTIRSRSQLVRFRQLSGAELRSVLGPEADEWVIEGARGSVEDAERLMSSQEDYQELEAAAAGFLEAATERFPGEEVGKLRELLKDRSAHGYAMAYIQGVVRDAMKRQAGMKPRSSKGAEKAVGFAARFGAGELGRLSESALQMEQDLARNVDRGLILENFALQWRQAASGA